MGFFSDITDAVSGIFDGISPGAAAVALGPLAFGGEAAGFGADALAGEGSIMGQGAGAGAALDTSGFGAYGAGAFGGASPAATTSLIQQLASYTGLSTGAIERLGGAAISSLAGLYGANKLGQASMDAANRLAGANQTATQLQSKMYEDQMARSQPYYDVGVNALKQYSSGILGTEEDKAAGRTGKLVRPFSVNDWLANQDPARQLIMDEMGRATLHQAAAGTGGLSGVFAGNTAKALQDRAGQQTNKFYTDAYNRAVNSQNTERSAIGNLAGFGPPANAAMTTAGTNYGANVNNLGINTATNYANADLTSAAARQSAYAGAGGAVNEAFNPDPRTAFYNNMMRVG